MTPNAFLAETIRKNAASAAQACPSGLLKAGTPCDELEDPILSRGRDDRNFFWLYFTLLDDRSSRTHRNVSITSDLGSANLRRGLRRKWRAGMDSSSEPCMIGLGRQLPNYISEPCQIVRLESGGWNNIKTQGPPMRARGLDIFDKTAGPDASC
jgi:hypothetical protein